MFKEFKEYNYVLLFRVEFKIPIDKGKTWYMVYFKNSRCNEYQ